MSDESIRPIPGDPSADEITEMLDIRNAEWLVAGQGEYGAAAVEAMKASGAGYQHLIALTWPARVNNSDEERMVRLLIHPEDAVGIAAVLLDSSKWLVAHLRQTGGDLK